MVRNSTTACAMAKPFTPMCSPRDGDCQKNSGLQIWTTSWPYFLTVLTTRIASNKRNLKIKWCVTQQLLVLWQNRLHQCVHHVMEIIRKIAACLFEQLRDLIFWTVLTTWIALNKRNLKIKWCVTQQLLVLRQNRLHQCVHHVMEIIRKIVACRFELHVILFIITLSRRVPCKVVDHCVFEQWWMCFYSTDEEHSTQWMASTEWHRWVEQVKLHNRQAYYLIISITWWTHWCKRFCRSTSSCWVTHHFIFKFLLFNAIQVVKTVQKIRSRSCSNKQAAIFLIISITWWTHWCKRFCHSTSSCWVTHHFIFKFLLFDAIRVVKTVKKYGHEVVQICKPLFFWQSPSRGEHIGVNGFAIAQAVVELRTILSSNFSYSMLFRWLRLSKNMVTKLFKSVNHYFSDNLHHVVNTLV